MERGDKVRLKELSKRISSLSRRNPGKRCLVAFFTLQHFPELIPTAFLWVSQQVFMFSCGSTCPDLFIRVI